MTQMDDLVVRTRAINHDLNQDRAERALRRKTLSIVKELDDGAAGTAADLPVFVVPAHLTNGIEVKSVSYCCDATGIAADNTDFATVGVSKRDGAGGSATVIAELSTDGNGTDALGGAGAAVVAFVPRACTLSGTLATRSLAAGNVLTLVITKGGAGKVVPAGVVTVVYDEL